MGFDFVCDDLLEVTGDNGTIRTRNHNTNDSSNRRLLIIVFFYPSYSYPRRILVLSEKRCSN